jgi:hypothetical protein
MFESRSAAKVELRSAGFREPRSGICTGKVQIRRPPEPCASFVYFLSRNTRNGPAESPSGRAEYAFMRFSIPLYVSG